MIDLDPYLHFDNIDMQKPDISSQCSHCGRTFKVELQAGERVDDVLLRIRAQFNIHQCREELQPLTSPQLAKSCIYSQNPRLRVS
jgi:hypothetical protein